MFLTSMAYAMGQPPAGAEGGNQLMSFLPLVLMFVVFYFLLIRPQQKKQKEMREMLKNLKRGDKVITGGGIEGRIDAVTDDKVNVEIAPGVVITVLRAYVAGLADSAQPKKPGKTDEKKADKPEEKK
jgi:preprotein translocase subunit YajC